MITINSILQFLESEILKEKPEPIISKKIGNCKLG